MLDSLRKAAGTWIAKLLLGLLILSFAVWGISGQIASGVGGNTVVAAGDTRVTPVEYRLAYDRQISVLSQQFGQRITREQATALGIDGQVLSQLTAGALLDEQARRMGLGLSRDRLATLTAEDPAFRGPDGRFDRVQFEFVLRQVGMRPEDYIRSRQQVAIRQQVVEAVSDGIMAPDVFYDALARYRGETRTIDYVVLDPATVEPIEPPADEALATYFEENRARYDAPEYRGIAYVKLEPEDIADPSAVTQDEIEADYERTRAAFTTPETRTIEQLVFASEEAARAARQRIETGDSFEDIVAAEGRTMGDVALGTFERARVGDPAIAEAAFDLEAGEVSDVVAGAFGHLLVRVTAVNPERTRPVEEVADQIRQDLALAEANRILLEVHDRYEDARAGGSTLQEAAEALELAMVAVEAVDRSGRDPAGNVIADLPESQALLREAFETEQGVENPSLPTGANGYVFFEVTSITPSRPRELDEIRDRVVADWTTAETARRLDEAASALRDGLAGGADIAALAAERELEVQTRRGITRLASDTEIGEQGVEAVFGVAEGETGVFAIGDNRSRAVFRVTEAIEPAGVGPDSIDEQNRTAMSSGLADDLLDQLVNRLQGEYGVTVNESAIRQALSF